MSKRTKAARKAARRRYYFTAWPERRQPDVPPVLRAIFDAIADAFVRVGRAVNTFVAQMRERGHLPLCAFDAARGER